MTAGSWHLRAWRLHEQGRLHRLPGWLRVRGRPVAAGDLPAWQHRASVTPHGRSRSVRQVRRRQVPRGRGSDGVRHVHGRIVLQAGRVSRAALPLRQLLQRLWPWRGELMHRLSEGLSLLHRLYSSRAVCARHLCRFRQGGDVHQLPGRHLSRRAGRDCVQAVHGGQLLRSRRRCCSAVPRWHLFEHARPGRCEQLHRLPQGVRMLHRLDGALALRSRHDCSGRRSTVVRQVRCWHVPA